MARSKDFYSGAFEALRDIEVSIYTDFSNLSTSAERHLIRLINQKIDHFECMYAEAQKRSELENEPAQ